MGTYEKGRAIPLIAIDTADHDTVIDLTNVADEVWSAIWRAQTGERLRCRGCRLPLYAKRMTATGLRFFAHSRAEPSCPSQGETARHLGLKVLFATAFRNAGWQAELEIAGEDWRADVLVSGPQGQSVAIEVQLAALTPDVVRDRMRRHRAAGVTTLWILSERRPNWAKQFSTVLVDGNDLVVDTVLLDISKSAARPVPASAATINRMVARWTQGRLTPIEDSEGLWFRSIYMPPVTQYFQLDGCVDDHFESERARRAVLALSAASLRQTEALAAQARVPANIAMATSLAAFKAWFDAQTKWKCWFGTPGMPDPRSAAHGTPWSLELGVLVLIGGFDPQYVFARVEPHGVSPNKDPRVAAWTTGADPDVDTSGFAVVYTPENVLGLADIPRSQMKPYYPRRRNTR